MSEFDDIFGEADAPLASAPVAAATAEFDNIFGASPATSPAASPAAAPQSSSAPQAAENAATAPVPRDGAAPATPMDENQQKAFLDWLDDAIPASPAVPAAGASAPGASVPSPSTGLPPLAPGRSPRAQVSPPAMKQLPPNESGARITDPLTQLRDLAAGRRVETDVEYIRSLCASLGGALPPDLRGPLWGLLLGRGGNGGDAELSQWLAAGGMVSRGSGGGAGVLPDHLELRNDCMALARRLVADGTKPSAPAGAATAATIADAAAEAVAAAAAPASVAAPENSLVPTTPPPLHDGRNGGGSSTSRSPDATTALAGEIEQVVSYYCRRRRMPYDPVLCALVGPLFALGLGKDRAAALLPPLAHNLTLFMGTGLSPEVQVVATKHAHRRFRFLVAYHAPQLGQHLDRSYPGWEMPRREAGESTHETKRLDEEAAALVDDIVARTPSRSRNRGRSSNTPNNGSSASPAAAAAAASSTAATGRSSSFGSADALAAGARALESEASPLGGSSHSRREGEDDSADGTREFVLGRCRVPEAESEGLVPPSLLTALFAALSTQVRPSAMLPVWDSYLVRGDRHFGYFLLLALLLRRKDELMQLQGPPLFAALATALSGDPGLTSNGGLDEEEVHQWCFEAEALDRATPESFRLHLGLIPEVAESEHAAVLHQQRLAWEQQRRERAAADATEKEAEEAEKAAEAAAAAEAEAVAQAAEAAEAAEAAAALTRSDAADEDVPSMFAADFLAANGAAARAPAASAGGASSTASSSSSSSKRLANMGRMMQAAGSKIAARVREDTKALSVAIVPRGKGAAASAGDDAMLQPPPEAPLELLMPQMCVSVGAMEVVASIGRREGQAGINQPSPTLAAATGLRGRHMELHRPRKELPFFAVDCRSKEEISRGRFPTAYQLDPSSMDDPEEMTKLLEVLEPLTGRVHIVLMGSGVAATALRNSTSSSSNSDPAAASNDALRKATRDDYSYVTTCALFFIKRGFPYVSVLSGGYAAAHDLLAASSAAAAAANGAAVAGMGLNTLVDHNAAVCVLCQNASQRRRVPEILPEPGSVGGASFAARKPPLPAGSPLGAQGEQLPGAGAKGSNGSGTMFRFQSLDLFKSSGPSRERLGSAPVKPMEELSQRFKKLSFSGMSSSSRRTPSEAPSGDAAAAAAAAAATPAAAGSSTSAAAAPRPTSLRSSSLKGLLSSHLRRQSSSSVALSESGHSNDAQSVTLETAEEPPHASASNAAARSNAAPPPRRPAAARAKQAASASLPPEENFFIIGDEEDSNDEEGDDDEGATDLKAVALLEHRLSGLVKGDRCFLREFDMVPGAEAFAVHKARGGEELPRTIFITRERLVVVAAAAGEGAAVGSAAAAAAAAADANGCEHSLTNGLGGAGSAEAARSSAAAGEESRVDSAVAAAAEAAPGGEEAAQPQVVVKSNHHLTQLVKMTFLKKSPLLITLHFRRVVPVAAEPAPPADAAAPRGEAGSDGPAAAATSSGVGAAGKEPAGWADEMRKNVYRLRCDEEKQQFITLLQQHLQRFRG